MTTVSLAPPHAIVFIFDPSNKGVGIPDYVDGQLVAASQSAVSVGTRPEVDGETVLTFARRGEAVDLVGLQVVFQGRIHAPGRKIAILTSGFEPIAERAIDETQAEVFVWTDDPRNPSRVAVILG